MCFSTLTVCDQKNNVYCYAYLCWTVVYFYCQDNRIKTKTPCEDWKKKEWPQMFRKVYGKPTKNIHFKIVNARNFFFLLTKSNCRKCFILFVVSFNYFFVVSLKPYFAIFFTKKLFVNSPFCELLLRRLEFDHQRSNIWSFLSQM